MDYNDVIACIDKLYSMGVLYLTFTGGEAFLYKRFDEIYTYAKIKDLSSRLCQIYLT